MTSKSLQNVHQSKDETAQYNGIEIQEMHLNVQYLSCCVVGAERTEV